MRVQLQVGESHLAEISKKGLLDGVAQLVWNAIDAEANNVDIDFIEREGRVEEVRVSDDGHGFGFDEARRAFGVLGDSWKASATRSRNGLRTLHGRRGEGRLSVFKHGGTAVWHSVARDAGVLTAVSVRVDAAARSGAEISEPRATEAPMGTRVTISNFGEAPAGIHGDAAYERLLLIFAIAIRAQGVRINFGGRQLDVEDLLDRELDLPVQADGQDARLSLLAWKRKVKPDAQFHFCDEHGTSLFAQPAQAEAHGVHYTAYLRWAHTAEHQGQLPAAGLDQGSLGRIYSEAACVLQSALDQLRDLRRREVIEGWKKRGEYPFEGEPKDATDRATRETFDLVAIEAASLLETSKPKARKLSLRLLKEALTHRPDQVHRILDQVLELDRESAERLDRLLSHTPLSRLISSSTAIAGRLEFLGALRDLTTDSVHRKHLKERSQLHKLVEAEPWVFGEEYALATSDRSLTEVLRQHLHLLGRSEVAAEVTEEVLDVHGRRGIVDLLFSGEIAGADDRLTMLVIELKRPSVAIGDDELAQMRRYAMAIAEEARFDLSRTKFEFWAVSTSVSKSVEQERLSDGPNRGLVKAYDTVPVRLWVKTWGEILHSASHRLRYVQDQLAYKPTQEQSFDYLRRMYADRLPATVREEAA